MSLVMSTLTDDLRQTVAGAAVTALPYVGSGAQAAPQLDATVTSALQQRLIGLGERHATGFRVARAEGERDGSVPLTVGSDGDEGLWLYADPVDGTTTGSRGGPRCFTVLSTDVVAPSHLAQTLSDSTSLFTLGCHTGDAADALARGAAGIRALTQATVAGGGRLGGLHRPDNRRLTEALFPDMTPWRSSVTTGYLPTIESDAVTLVGDGTVTLPFEVDAAVGRTGFVEALIEAALWPSWAALVVSKEAAALWPGGLLAYVDSYVQALRSRAFRMEDYFTFDEVAAFRATGVEDTMLSVLDAEAVGRSEQATTFIASITGNVTEGMRLPCHAVAPVRVEGGGVNVSMFQKLGSAPVEVFTEQVEVTTKEKQCH